MSEKTLKFGTVVLNKKDLHASKKNHFKFSRYLQNSSIRQI